MRRMRERERNGQRKEGEEERRTGLAKESKQNIRVKGRRNGEGGRRNERREMGKEGRNVVKGMGKGDVVDFQVVRELAILV